MNIYFILDETEQGVNCMALQLHCNANSTYLGSIQPSCKYCAKNIRSNIHLCLQPGTHL